MKKYVLRSGDQIWFEEFYNREDAEKACIKVQRESSRFAPMWQIVEIEY